MNLPFIKTKGANYTKKHAEEWGSEIWRIKIEKRRESWLGDGRGNLRRSRPDIVRVMMKGREEGMSRRRGGSKVGGSTHICGAVPGVVPDVIHQGGEMLQAVGDVVRKEQDAHRLQTQQQEKDEM